MTTSLIPAEEQNSERLLEIADRVIRLYRNGDKSMAINTWMDAARELRSIRQATLVLLQLIMETSSSVVELHTVINDVATLLKGGQLSTGNSAPDVTKVGTTTVVGPAFDCGVGDYIMFEGLTETGRSLIEKYGPWWSIQSGRAATRPGQEGKHQCWYMQSVGHARQGLKKPAGLKNAVENVWWFEKNDEHFRLKKRHRGVNFNYKDYE